MGSAPSWGWMLSSNRSFLSWTVVGLHPGWGRTQRAGAEGACGNSQTSKSLCCCWQAPHTLLIPHLLLANLVTWPSSRSTHQGKHHLQGKVWELANVNQWHRLPSMTDTKFRPAHVPLFWTLCTETGPTHRAHLDSDSLSQGCKFIPIKMETKLHCFFDGLIQIIRLAIKTNLPIRFWSPCFT